MNVLKRLALSSFALVSVGLFAAASFGGPRQVAAAMESVEDTVELGIEQEQTPCGKGLSCQMDRCKDSDACKTKCGFGFSCLQDRCKADPACKDKGNNKK